MKILSYSELKSHPNKKLETHLENVAIFSKRVFNSLNIDNNNLFSDISFLIGLTHDFAKSTSFFQEYLVNHKQTKYKNHSFLSAIFTYYVVNDFLTKEDITYDKYLSVMAYFVVLKHHSNLNSIDDLDQYTLDKCKSNEIQTQVIDLKSSQLTLESFYKRYDVNFNYFLENFNSICEDLVDELFNFILEEDIDNYFIIALFFSVLTDADKMDASGTAEVNRKEIPSDAVDVFKKHIFSDEENDMNKIREEAYVEVINNIESVDLSNHIFSIQLPTGIGKTFIGVSSALKLKKRILDEKNINARFIYSLPFLSIIDQNEELIRSILNFNGISGNDYLLKHSHLSDMVYNINSDFEEEYYYDINNSKLLIEGWNSEIIITTFIQLFYSLISNKNRSLRKFHNITNSIILLDEIQSIPYKYWDVINLILKKLTEEYNCWIILMTATKPLIFKNNECYPLISDESYYFSQFDRVEYNFDLKGKSLDEFKRDVINSIKSSEKDILVVLNTINSSVEVYNSIKCYFYNDYDCISIDENGICVIDDDIQLIYLSTNIIPKDRLKRISRIKDSNKRNIIISTQLIEAGVDIDVDIIFRDLAPLDSIIQAAGRCNRNNKYDTGEVNVVSIVNDNNTPYSRFVYGSFLLNTTRELLEHLTTVTESEFNYNASKRYFDLINERGNKEMALIKLIERLDYNNISSEFKLIEELVDKVDVFININNESEQLLNRFYKINDELSGFVRKNEFLKIKSKFYNYVISVNVDKIGATNKMVDNELFVVNKDEISRKYDYETGFIPEDEEDPFII